MLEEAGGYGSTSILGAAVILSQSQQLARGAFYSMGMEIINGYRNTPIFGAGNTYQIGSTYLNLDPSDFLGTSRTLPAGVLGLSDEAAKSAMGSRALTNAAVPSSAFFPVLNIGFTALTGMSRYSEGGGAELGRFLIEDMYAQLYGNQASEIIGRVTSENAVALERNYGLASGSVNNQNIIGQKVQGYRSVLGSAMLGRALPVLGAYEGARIGFGIGQSIGDGIGSMMFDGSYGLGLLGGVMGAKYGAMAGAAMTKNIPALALSALAVGSTMLMTEAVGDILKSGLKKVRSRGLDFAGDVSAYNTNAAVTMRQRAVQSMHKSHMNARSALGQEASFQHMNRDYFAHYRRY